MSFGYQRQPRAFINDSPLLNAYVYEDDELTLIPLVEINNVVFTIRQPGEEVPVVDAEAGEIVDDGHATYLVSDTVTTVPGEYRAIAQFVLNDGRKKTSIVDFDVIDPFEDKSASPWASAVDQAWVKLEDCFDSEIGGPWLRDMTLARFDKSRFERLLPEAMIEINTWQPVTSYTVDAYPYADPSAESLLAQGLLCSAIRHLMRSYTEQPEVMNNQAGFLDRTRYADAWRAIYEEEYRLFKQWLALYKRPMLQLGHAKVLIGTKAGRLMPGPMRARTPGRGYW